MENKLKAVGFDFFLGSRTSEGIKKGDGSCDDKSSINSLYEESKKSSEASHWPSDFKGGLEKY